MPDSSNPRPPVRILRVLPWIVSGGVEKRALMLARLLGPNFEQRILTMRAEDPLKSEIEACGVPVERVGKDWGLSDASASFAIRREIQRFKPQIVHAGVFEATYHATLACLSAPKTKLILEEIDYPLMRSWRADALNAGLYKRADAVVAVSDAVADYIGDKMRPGQGKLHTITNGAERVREVKPEEAAAVRAELGIPKDAVIVVTVGRMFESQKRMSTLIRAFAKMAPDHPKLHILLVGDGVDRPTLERLKETECAQADKPRVHFTGYQRDVARYLAAADIFANTSNRESFGQALVEGMQAGLAIVSTMVGGPAEIVQPYRTGLSIPVDDPDALVAALQTLLSDPQLRARLGGAARERALGLYTPERYVDDVRALYEELLAS